jgi:hypothetical protein
MQEAVVVLDVLRERGRKGLPFTQLYRQMFNKELYLLARVSYRAAGDTPHLERDHVVCRG